MNPLNSVKGSIAAGIVVAIAIAAAINHDLNPNVSAIIRWFHILAGVMWIGLLYYFNAVQVPGLADAASDKGGPGGAGISKYIAPRALLWFRWAAVATWLTGAAYLAHPNPANFIDAFTFGMLRDGSSYYHQVIGAGAWLGTIMLFNVWALIWPNQQKILGLVPATEEEKAKARNVAKYASRTNFVLSVPMLMCMGSAVHGLPF
jgi:uncharacterized membrane protein